MPLNAAIKNDLRLARQPQTKGLKAHSIPEKHPFYFLAVGVFGGNKRDKMFIKIK